MLRQRAREQFYPRALFLGTRTPLKYVALSSPSMSIFESLHVLGQLWFWVLLGSALFLALYSWQFGLDSDMSSPPPNISASFDAPAGTSRRALRQQQQTITTTTTTFRIGDFLFGVLPNAMQIKWREIDLK
jgi:hypothetical protein